MLVQRVVMPGGGPESWTVLDDTGEVIDPAERYLAYLSAIEWECHLEVAPPGAISLI